VALCVVYPQVDFKIRDLLVRGRIVDYQEIGSLLEFRLCLLLHVLDYGAINTLYQEMVQQHATGGDKGFNILAVYRNCLLRIENILLHSNSGKDSSTSVFNNIAFVANLKEFIPYILLQQQQQQQQQPNGNLDQLFMFLGQAFKFKSLYSVELLVVLLQPEAKLFTMLPQFSVQDLKSMIVHFLKYFVLNTTDELAEEMCYKVITPLLQFFTQRLGEEWSRNYTETEQDVQYLRQVTELTITWIEFLVQLFSQSVTSKESSCSSAAAAVAAVEHETITTTVEVVKKSLFSDSYKLASIKALPEFQHENLVFFLLNSAQGLDALVTHLLMLACSTAVDCVKARMESVRILSRLTPLILSIHLSFSEVFTQSILEKFVPFLASVAMQNNAPDLVDNGIAYLTELLLSMRHLGSQLMLQVLKQDSGDRKTVREIVRKLVFGIKDELLVRSATSTASISTQ
jgi:hypothetical protein